MIGFGTQIGNTPNLFQVAAHVELSKVILSQGAVYERFSESAYRSSARLHINAGGCTGNWPICNGNHTEIIVLAYASRRDVV